MEIKAKHTHLNIFTAHRKIVRGGYEWDGDAACSSNDFVQSRRKYRSRSTSDLVWTASTSRQWFNSPLSEKNPGI